MRFCKECLSIILLFQIAFTGFAQLPSGISVNFYVRTFPASENSNVILTADNAYILEPLINGFVCSNLTIKWVIYGTGKHTISNINANSPTITLTPGTYSVELYAGTSPANAFEFCGASSNSRKKTSWITVPYTTPVAKFKTNGAEVASTTVALNSTVKFADASGKYPTSWLWSVTPNTGWSFTSGNSSSQNADIKFTSSGDYTVALKATNPGGTNTVSKLNHVKVLAGPPTADFNANGSGVSPVIVLQNVAVSLNDLSTNKPTAWEWTISPSTGFSFSSGTKNSQSPKITFSALGQYSVSLKATNTGGENILTKANYIKVSPPTPGVVSPKNYCKNQSATYLTATGSNLKWYTSSSGGVGSSAAPLPSTVNTGTFSYYVSQTIGGIEGARAKLDVVVNDLPVAPGVNSSVNYCLGSNATPLTATVTTTGNLLRWYTTASGGTGSGIAPTPTTTNIGTTNYYVSQSKANGCEGARAMIAIKVSASLDAPIAATPINFCLGYPATALQATGSGLKWYTVASGGTALAEAPIPATNISGAKMYYVAQTVQGCPESPRTTVTVNVMNGAPPLAPGVNSPVTYMQGTRATPLTATGSNLTWYAALSGGNGSIVAPVPVTTSAATTSWFVSQTNANCEGPMAKLDVVVTPTPGGTADWVWAKNMPGYNPNGKVNEQIVVDSAGNTFIAGVFSGTITLGSTTLSGNGDIYLAKYDPSGNVMWAKKVTSGSGNEQVFGLAMDEEGSFFLCGSFSNQAVFGHITYDNTASFPYSDAFIAKYDSTGTVEWATRYNNSTHKLSEVALTICLEKSGNVFVVGTEHYKSGSNIFNIAFSLRLDSLGVTKAYRSMNGGEIGIGADDFGNSYVAGAVTVASLSNPRRLYFAKYSAANEIIWQKIISANATANSIAVDKNGNSYIIGNFTGSVSFGNITLSGTGSFNLFLVKYDASGQPVWAKKTTGALGNAVTLDRFGNCFIAGAFRDSAIFDNITVKSNRIDGFDIFAAKYNPAGEIIWVQKAGGMNDARGNGIGVDKSGNTYVTGTYNPTAIFGTETITGASRFIAKLGSAIPVLPELFTDRLAEETYIAGDKLDINFSTSGTFGNENFFSAQLSDAYGSFTDPIYIGTGQSSPIKAMIPVETIAGNNYKLRVVASQPEIVGTDNGTNIVINAGTASSAPNWVWGKNLPEVSSILSWSKTFHATDALGNTYVTGSFYGSFTIGNVTITSSYFDIYVVKYNSDGNMLWLRKASGGAGEEKVQGIALDAAGNYYLTGGYKGAATFGALGLTNTTEYFDLFVVKYDSIGTAQWAKKYESQYAKNDAGLVIAVNANGNGVYVGGHTDQWFQIDTNTWDPWEGLLIQKYDGNGQLLWTSKPSGYRVDEPISSMVLDDVDNVYLTGYRRTLLNGVTTNKLLVYKFNPTGGKVWEKTSTNNNAPGSGIAIGSNGSIYVTGSCGGAMEMGGVTSGVFYFNYDVFVTKLNTEGETQWIKQAGGFDLDQSTGIKVDRSGNIIITGSFQHTAIFGDISITHSNSGRGDVFVAKYDTSGNIIWVQKAGFGGNDEGNAIGLDDAGNSYISGVYFNSILFGDSSLTGERFFVAKLGANAAPSRLTFSPSSGSVGDTVTIKGSGFVDVSNVHFNGQAASYFQVDSTTQIKAVVATGTNTGAVSVSSMAGGKGTSNEPFTMIDKATGTVMLCPPAGNTQLTSNLSGATYQWQVNMGSGYTNIADDIHYLGTNTRSLTLTEIPASWNGYQYRCRVNSSNSKTFKLEFIVAWTGQENSIWENANNWSCGVIPDENTRVHFSSNSVVLISSNVRVKSMTAMPGATITVKPGYTILLDGE